MNLLQGDIYIERYKDTGTLSEKTEQFMLDLGITAEEIAAIKTIMLEKYLTVG